MSCITSVAMSIMLAIMYTHELRAAKAGDQDAMEIIKDGYIEGYVTKEEYK